MRVGLVFAIAAVCLTACSSSSSSPSLPSPSLPATALSVATNPQSLRAITITSCAPNGQHNVRISGRVRNPTSRPAAYVIELSIRDKSGRAMFATAAAARNVAPKAVADWIATTSARFEPGMTCVVTGVSQR